MFGNEYTKMKADASLVSVQYASSGISIINGPEGYIIVSKWLTDSKLILVIVIWVILEATFFVNYAGAVGWHNFNLLHYPSFTIVSLFIGYFVAMGVLNKTTTVITDTTFSVRRGPVPCPWPGNHTREIDDVERITYACHNSVIVNGNCIYYVYVIFGDGRQAGLFNIVTIGSDKSLAVRLATQIQGWIDEKRRAKLGFRFSSNEQPSILESAWFPPDRSQRLKIMASIVAVVLALAALMAAAEYLAAPYRGPH